VPAGSERLASKKMRLPSAASAGGSLVVSAPSWDGARATRRLANAPTLASVPTTPITTTLAKRFMPTARTAPCVASSYHHRKTISPNVAPPRRDRTRASHTAK